MTYLHRPGPGQFVPSLINERDQIAGTVEGSSPATERPVLWQRGRFTDLPVPAGTAGYVSDIDNHGRVVGRLYDRDTLVSRAVLWRRGRMTDLGTLGGPSAAASAINERGQVIGHSTYDPRNPDAERPFLWQRGRMIDLLAGTGAVGGRVFAINNHGTMVGYAQWAGTGIRPVMWRSGRMIDIGLPGRSGSAMAVNDRGDVAGRYHPPTSDDDPIVKPELFRWRNGHTTLYPKTGRGLDIDIAGIDRRGTVAATYEAEQEGPNLMRTA